MLYISQSIQSEKNLFDLSAATVGWVNQQETRNDYGFLTGDYLSVAPGDVITFGGAVTTQGWHFVVYDRHLRPLDIVTISNGIAVFGQLNDELSIMQYVVADGVAYLRPVIDSRFSHQFVLTRNQVFTAEQYREWMTGSHGCLVTNGQQVNQDGYTVILNLEGEGDMLIQGEKTAFSPGTVHCIPPKQFFYKKSEAGYRDIRLVCRQFGSGGGWRDRVAGRPLSKPGSTDAIDAENFLGSVGSG